MWETDAGTEADSHARHHPCPGKDRSAKDCFSSGHSRTATNAKANSGSCVCMQLDNGHM